MDMKEQQEFYNDSTNPELCKKIYAEAIEYIHDQGASIEDHQKKALLNHISEMIKRDSAKELVAIEDTDVFNEISDESLGKAKELVNQLENADGNEVYLLAVHFEVVKFN